MEEVILQGFSVLGWLFTYVVVVVWLRFLRKEFGYINPHTHFLWVAWLVSQVMAALLVLWYTCVYAPFRISISMSIGF